MIKAKQSDTGETKLCFAGHGLFDVSHANVSGLRE